MPFFLRYDSYSSTRYGSMRAEMACSGSTRMPMERWSSSVSGRRDFCSAAIVAENVMVRHDLPLMASR